MRISTLGYVGKQGVKNIWRNKMFSLASIATMSACIFLFGLFFSILVNFQYIIRTAEEGVAITVFFDEDATDAQEPAIGEEHRARAIRRLFTFRLKRPGTNSKRNTSATTRSLRKDLQTTIRLRHLITMKCIWRRRTMTRI